MFWFCFLLSVCFLWVLFVVYDLVDECLRLFDLLGGWVVVLFYVWVCCLDVLVSMVYWFGCYWCCLGLFDLFDCGVISYLIWLMVWINLLGWWVVVNLNFNWFGWVWSVVCCVEWCLWLFVCFIKLFGFVWLLVIWEIWFVVLDCGGIMLLYCLVFCVWYA